ncbi:MAG: sodium:solute symporter family protein, partial [Clostridia bacterium]|nr:sodium:solute symporter family protein [Clostridia bacterium]
GWFAASAGLGIFAQYLVIYSVASLVIMYLMARPVWIWGKVFDLETQADMIGLRYGNKKFKVLFSLATFLFWFPWLILEMKTIGYIVAAATYHSINFNIGMIIVSLFVVIYSFYGGARATAIGNLVQGITFTVIGTITVYYLIRKIYGGVFAIYPVLQELKPELLTLQGGFGGNYWASVIITCTLGAFTLPGIFNRIYMADSPKAVKKSVFIAPLAGVFIGFLTLALGLGAGLLEGFPADAQSAIFWMADHYGGPFVLALIGIFALSACMSTISAVINTASVLIAKDLASSVVKNLSRETMLKYAKGLTIGVGLISLYIATIDLPNLMMIALVMYDCIVQAFIPLFVGLFWRKSNLPGAFAGMLIGVVIALYGNLNPQSIAWTGGWSAGMVGMGVNFIVHIICGFAFGKQKHVDEIFKVVNNYKQTEGSKLI